MSRWRDAWHDSLSMSWYAGITDPACACFTAISNGRRNTSFSSRHPRCTGPWLRAPSLHEWPAKCFSVASRSRFSPCRPRTNRVPSTPTRYGSSASVSSVRPQRTSRETSSTGASPWWQPTDRASRPMACRRALDEIGVPGRAVGERRREHRGAAGHQADEALLVRQRRDPEPRLLAQELLQPVEGPHAGARVDAVAAERARNLAQALVQRLLHRLRIGAPGEVVLARTMPAVLGEDQPQRVHLRRLFLERHSREQVGCTLVDRPAGILVGMRHGRGSEKTHANAANARRQTTDTPRGGRGRRVRIARSMSQVDAQREGVRDTVGTAGCGDGRDNARPAGTPTAAPPAQSTAAPDGRTTTAARTC